MPLVVALEGVFDPEAVGDDDRVSDLLQSSVLEMGRNFTPDGIDQITFRSFYSRHDRFCRSDRTLQGHVVKLE